MLLLLALTACDPKPSSAAPEAAQYDAQVAQPVAENPTGTPATPPGALPPEALAATPSTTPNLGDGGSAATDGAPPSPELTATPVGTQPMAKPEKSAKVEQARKEVDREIAQRAGLLKMIGTSGASSGTAADLWADPASLSAVENALAGSEMIEPKPYTGGADIGTATSHPDGGSVVIPDK